MRSTPTCWKAKVLKAENIESRSIFTRKATHQGDFCCNSSTFHVIYPPTPQQIFKDSQTFHTLTHLWSELLTEGPGATCSTRQPFVSSSSAQRKRGKSSLSRSLLITGQDVHCSESLELSLPLSVPAGGLSFELL